MAPLRKIGALRRQGRALLPETTDFCGPTRKTDRHVRTDLKKLEELGFILHENRDRRRSNTYFFLWPPVFENRESDVAQEPDMDNLSGSTLPIKAEVETSVTSIERKHTSGQFQSLSGSTLLTNSVQGINTHTRSIALPDRSASAWPRGGWETPEEFETWWRWLVQGQPNKNRNSVAKTKAIELVIAGKLIRAEFDEGYAAVKAAKAERWSEQHGRFASNLWQFLDDQEWKHAPPPLPAASEYQNANDYLRRIENE